MHSWRLLLLAVVVVVQPIGSFTESNLIDGRECCESSEDARLYGNRKNEESRSLDGNRDYRHTANEERLKTLNELREERRYETIRSPILTRSGSLERSERRISSEPSWSTEHRQVREQRRRQHTFARTWETREDQNRNQDESRNILGQNKQDSRESRDRETLDATRTILSRDVKPTGFAERESGYTMSRLQIRAIRSNEERRSAENREGTTLKRERENIVRSDTRRDSRLSSPARFDSRSQLDDSRERKVSDRHLQKNGNEFRQSRFFDARINEVRAQRTIEQNGGNNRDYREVEAELRSSQRDTELRDRVSSVRRDSADRTRETRVERMVRDRMDTRNNQRTDERRQQRDESRRSFNTLRNTEDQRLDSRQSRASREIDTTRRTDERMERRTLSMERFSMPRESRESSDSRLSRSSEMNIRDERATRIRDFRDERINDRRQERDTNRITRDKTESKQEIRSTTSRTTEERSQQREVRNSIEQRQRRVTLRTISSRNTRDLSEVRMQQRDASRLSKDSTISATRELEDTERRQELSRNIRESSEERRLQREDSRRSRERTSSFREVRDNSEREQRDNNLYRNRISNAMLRQDSLVRNNERSQEGRMLVSRPDVRDNERSDLRRQVLERSIEVARRSMSAERRNDIRDTSRTMSTEASRVDERNERQRTRDQDRTFEQRVTRNVATPQRLDSRRSMRTGTSRLERAVKNRDRESGDRDMTDRIVVQRVTRNLAAPQRLETRRSQRTENIRPERVVRNRDVRESGDQDRTDRIDVQRISRIVATPQRIDTNRLSRSESIRLVRNRADVRGNERREMQREERDGDRTRILLNRQSTVSVFAERRQDRESSEDSRKVRMTRNRSQVRRENVLAERRQENRDAIRDSRNNRDEVRSERVIDERRQNSDSRNVRGISVDSRHQRDTTRDSRDRYLQRESRDATDRLTEMSRTSIERNERARNNEREVKSDRTLRTDVRREATNDIRTNNVLNMVRAEKRLAKDELREETSFRNNDAMFRSTLVQESDGPIFSNWQMVFYTLQGVYLCGLLVQMVTENANRTKKRTFNWWSSPKNLIKMD